MKILYPCGQPIPPSTLAALRFAGKTGFMGRETWGRFFALGTSRSKRRQIDRLVMRGYLRPHRNTEAVGAFVIGARALALLNEQHWSYVAPVPIGQLGHDKAVGHSLLALEQEGLIHSWVTERELIRDRDRHYLVQKKDSMTKYPDAIFKMHAFGSPMTTALEYEANRKSSSRYKAILRAYSGMTDLSMVLFVCQNATIQKTIQGCLKQFGQTTLWRQVAFADAEEWKKSPANAAITIRRGTIRLGEICANASKQRAA